MSIRPLALAVLAAVPLAAQVPSVHLDITESTSNTPVLERSSGGFQGYAPPVKNQPYSLLETITTVKTLADGSHITHTNQQRRYRDSEGRSRTEVLEEVNGEQRILRVMISDSVARLNYTISPRTKAARVSRWPEVKQRTPEQEAEMRAKVEKARAEAAANPKTAPTPSVTTEKLGQRNIAGVLAEGARITRIVPAGAEGNDRELRSTFEYWTSPDLHVDLEHTTDDPQSGKMTISVSELVRGEPDAALFRVPEDYKLIEPQPNVGNLQ